MKTNFMKKASVLLLMLGCCAWGMAQETEESNKKQWNKHFGLGMDVRPMTMMPKEGDNLSAFGVYVGVLTNFQFGSLDIETGLGYQRSSASQNQTIMGTYCQSDYDWTTYSFNLDLGYKYDIPNTKISVIPFVGGTIEPMLSGTLKTRVSGSSMTSDLKDYSDMGGANWSGTMNIEGGVKVCINDFILAKVKYNRSFNDMAKDLSAQYIGIGVYFIIW